MTNSPVLYGTGQSEIEILMIVPDTVIKIKDLELVEFMDYVQTILNRGLYEFRTFDATPDWTANEGENGILVTGDTLGLYVHINSTWTLIAFNSIGTLTLFDADGDPGITPEFTADEDVLRFYSAGTYVVAIDTYGIQVNPAYKMVFDGLGGDTYWTYSSASTYLQCHVNGTLRMEM